MREKTQDNLIMGYSIEYPRRAERIDFRLGCFGVNFLRAYIVRDDRLSGTIYI